MGELDNFRTIAEIRKKCVVCEMETSTLGLDDFLAVGLHLLPTGLSAFPDWLRSNQAVLQLASLARVGAFRSNAIEEVSDYRNIDDEHNDLDGRWMVVYLPNLKRDK